MLVRVNVVVGAGDACGNHDGGDVQVCQCVYLTEKVKCAQFEWDISSDCIGAANALQRSTEEHKKIVEYEEAMEQTKKEDNEMIVMVVRFATV